MGHQRRGAPLVAYLIPALSERIVVALLAALILGLVNALCVR